MERMDGKNGEASGARRAAQRGSLSNRAIASLITLSPLPVSLSSFIGREEIAADIAKVLRQPETRLLTLTGPGGVGKTRLAVRVAAGTREAFVDGVGFVALADVWDPVLVLPTIAQRLGVQEGDRRSLIERVSAAFGRRRCLLVLDNFEQVADAGPMLIELLGACPHVTLFVTSRAPLRVSGERVVPIPPLGLPEAGTGAEVIDAEAVRLFIARAEAVNPGVTRTEATRPAIAEICARLDGLPLAIELAAVRSSLLSPPAMLALLEQRLPMLTSGSRDQPARLQTMRAAIAWSYELLHDEERALFRGLSVFVGGFSLTAAATVCNQREGDMLMSLETLVDQSLVQVVAGMTEEPRYTMLETIREFGQDQLTDAGDADDAQERHARYFTALAERIDMKVDGPEAPGALVRLDREQANLQGALGWLLGQGQAEAALRLATALGRYWRIRGKLAEGDDLLARALALPGSIPLAIRANALWRLGVLRFYAGKYDMARRDLEQSVQIFEACEDEVGRALAMHSLGTVLRLQRSFDPARRQHEQELAIHLASGDRLRQELSIAGLGLVALERGDLATGRELLEQALSMAQQLGVPLDISGRYLNLARLELAEGRVSAAQVYVDSAKTIAEETGNQMTFETVLELLGRIAHASGDTGQAISYLVQCLQLRLKLGLLYEINDIAEALAAAAVSFDTVLATELLGSAAADREATGVPRLPRHAAEYEDSLSLARAMLGSDVFAEAWRRGAGLTILAAVHEAVWALADVGNAPEGEAPGSKTPGHQDNLGLTPRELEILRLVAAGHTNRVIAGSLFISPATVKRHVTNILAKLGLATRAAAISYALREGLIDG